MIYPEKAWPTSSFDFETIITQNFHYVDKTADMWRLANQRTNLFFLGRPRRFGKSLLSTTLEAYFLGKSELFKGLEAEQLEAQKGDNAWLASPVLRFDMSLNNSTPEFLTNEIVDTLTKYENLYNLSYPGDPRAVGNRFKNLILALAQQGQPPVILIDEYDAPLAHSLGPEEETRKNHTQFQAILRDFYTILKGALKQVRFAMLTGVSQFRQVNVFSGLNNITDITLDPNYASICGISEDELRANFDWRVQELASVEGKSLEETYKLLKRNYDGYRFTREEISLYNPYSLIWCFATLVVDSYWYTTGTPYVLRVLFPDLWYNFTEPEGEEGVSASGKQLLAFDPDSNDPVPILFQAGYLTIMGYQREGNLYQLTFPNIEVRDAFYDDNKELILGRTGRLAINTAKKMAHQINSGDVPGMMESLRILLANVPYTVKLNDKPVPEALFQVALFFVMRLTGKETQMEVMSLEGRSDIEVHPKNFIYIFELKTNESPQAALDQIVDRHYGDHYEDSGKRIIEIGISFNPTTYQFDWLAQYHKGAMIEPKKGN